MSCMQIMALHAIGGRAIVAVYRRVFPYLFSMVLVLLVLTAAPRLPLLTQDESKALRPASGTLSCTPHDVSPRQSGCT